jgi:amino acid transporter
MMIFVFPVLYFGWKFLKKTKVKKAHEIDLYTGVEEIDEYTRNFVEEVPRNVVVKWLNRIFS